LFKRLKLGLIDAVIGRTTKHGIEGSAGLTMRRSTQQFHHNSEDVAWEKIERKFYLQEYS